MGRHRLPDDVRGSAADRRPHRRPAVAQVGLPDRPRRVHPRVHRQRLRRQRDRAHHHPRGAGALGSPPDPGGAVHHHDHLLGRPASHRPRPLGCRRVARCRRRRPARGSPDHLGRLADHLLDQRADRCRRPPGRHQGHPRGTHRPGLAPAVRPGRRRHRHRQPGRADLRPRRDRAARLALRTGPGLAGRVRAAGRGLRHPGASRLEPARPAAHVAGQAPRLGHHRDAGRHRHPGRHGLPDLDLRPDRPGLLRDPRRPGVRAVRPRHHRRHGPRQARPRARHPAHHRRHRPAHGRGRGGAAGAGLHRGRLRHRRAARSGRHRPRRGHGVRARVGDGDGRHPAAARRHGLGVPHDRPRGRGRARRRRPVRGRRHGREPGRAPPVS